MGVISKRILAMLIGGFILVAILYVGLCFFVANKRDQAFGEVKLGDAESRVIDLFGEPSMREQQGQGFDRYATVPCIAPCFERLWFENRLALDVEAWSIELDQSRSVIKKYHWVSP